MSGINRRQFLAGSIATMAASGLPWARTFAQAQAGQPERNLVVVFVSGGWDVTASIDPKPGLTTVDAPPGQVGLFKNIPVLTGDDRPLVADFFTRWADVTAVINGIEVRSIAHEECTKRILTGTNDASRPDIGAIAASTLGANLPVPYMVLGDNAFTGPYGGLTGRAGTSGQFITLLHPDAAYSRQFGGPSPFAPESSEAALIKSYVTERALEHKASVGAGSGGEGARLDDFLRSLSNRDKIKPLLSSVDGFSSQLEFLPQIDLAVKVLKEGLSRATLIQHPGSWDTHADNDARQITLIQDLYGGLNTLLQRLEEEGLFESTVVVVTSEMSRTPKLNDALGKDHWPITSALVIGADVQGGQVFGGTDDDQNALPTSLQTGKPGEGAEQKISSSNFAAGVLDLVGVDVETHLPDVAALGGFYKG